MRESTPAGDGGGDEAPDSQPQRPYYDSQQQYAWQLPLIGGLALFGVVTWLVFVVFRPARNLPRRDAATVVPAPPAPTPPPPQLLPGLVLFAAPGAQDEDLFLAVEDPPSSGKRWLERVSGATGRVVWKRSASDGPDLGTGFRAWVDGGLLVLGADKVSALNPESGETLWTRDSGGPIRELCTGNGFAGLVFPDGRRAAFSITTGATLRDRTDACEPAVTSRSVAPNFTMVDGRGIQPPLPPRAPFRGGVARVLVPHKGTARVALASDRLAASVAVAGRKSWVWSTRLAEGKSGVPRFLVPPLAAVRSERVVVPYVLDAELRLASLELGSGRLAWDRSLTSKSVQAETPDAELRVSQHGAIYFSDGRGRLWAIAFDSGSAWTWGEK